MIDALCFISKNLYNSALYKVKTHYSETGKLMGYYDLEKYFRAQKDENYFMLPASTSQQILMLFDKNIKSYLALLKKWKKDKTGLRGCPHFPKYKDKVEGRNIILFICSQVKFKNNEISFPKKIKLNKITTKLLPNDIIKTCRIVPRSGSYIIEIVYVREYNIKNDGTYYSSIDLGLNNLATATIQNSNSLIINGKPLKSINQYYNKKKAKIQSELKKNYNKNWSNKLQKLANKRNNKIKDYLHKSSRIVVDCLVKSQVKNLVVGYNKEWKQDINLGKRNNQNFVNIPFLNFVNMLKYKCMQQDINFILHEESYTSKCSALDSEVISYHDNYLGKRIKRGLYKTKNNILINADINGSLNIGRKEFGDDYFNPANIGLVLNPAKINSL